MDRADGFAAPPSKARQTPSHHIVEGSDKLTVQFSDGREVEAVMVQHSQGTDLALLAVAETPAFLTLAPPRALSVGDAVFTLGFPAVGILGEGMKFTEGSVSSLSGLRGDASYFQMSVPVQPGNSGGPVINMAGEVVGVVAATAKVEAFYAVTGALPQNVNWASKSDHASLLFDPPLVERQDLDRKGAIRKAQSAVCSIRAVRETAVAGRYPARVQPTSAVRSIASTASTW